MKNTKIIGVIVILIFVVGGVFWAMLQGFEPEPPQPKLTLEGKSVPVLQGSYCWSGFGKGKCVDMIDPPEMIKQKQYTPVVATPESKLTIQFEKEPTNGSLVARQWKEGNPEVEIKNNTVTLPKEKGYYIYVIDGRWDEGSSSYVFAVEVR